MATQFSRIARFLALPAISVGILGGAALGLAGMASAGTYSYEPTPRPGIVAKPNTFAPPPFVVIPDPHWHHHRGLSIDFPGGE